MTPRHFTHALVSAGALLTAPAVSATGHTIMPPVGTRGCTTTIVVTNANDSGAGSLRNAVLNACNNGTIRFADRFVIDLQSPIAVSSTLTIDGSSQSATAAASDANLVQIIGGATHRSFQINASGELTLRRLRISNSTTSDRGGAILNQGKLTVLESRFDGNATGSQGGGAIVSTANSTLLVDGSTFDGNSSQRGSAIYNEGNAELRNSTFSDNNGTTGEGAIQNRGTLVAIHITVANNGVSPNGTGGLFAFNADTTLINSMFADNIGRDCRISGGTVSAIGLLAESNAGCTPQITTDPQLQALAARGGFTATRALASTSPAIGTGDPAFCLPVDQRGAPRAQQAGCDLGAFENERVFANGFQGPL